MAWSVKFLLTIIIAASVPVLLLLLCLCVQLGSRDQRE
jgi:hypothetical protein